MGIRLGKQRYDRTLDRRIHFLWRRNGDRIYRVGDGKKVFVRPFAGIYLKKQQEQFVADLKKEVEL